MTYAHKAEIERISEQCADWNLRLAVQAYLNIRLVCREIEADRRRIMRGRQMAEVR
jgi:hypothetical protein